MKAKARAATSLDLICTAVGVLLFGRQCSILSTDERDVVVHEGTEKKARAARCASAPWRPKYEAEVQAIRSLRKALGVTARRLAEELGSRYFFLPGACATRTELNLSSSQYQRLSAISLKAGLSAEAALFEVRASSPEARESQKSQTAWGQTLPEAAL